MQEERRHFTPKLADRSLSYTQSGMAKRKNPAAVGLAKRKLIVMTAEERRAAALPGAALGGKTRAATLTPAKRKEIAQKAAAARWGNKVK
jgi:hypothetical protein